MFPRLVSALLVAASWALVRDLTPVPIKAASSGAVVVVSDLHMGEGRDSHGRWSPLEDFRWAEEFTAFLDAVSADGKGATDLILNGDTFDLVQSSTSTCAYADASLGCTEPEILLRLDGVLAAHRLEIAALSRFARTGSNHVVFVPGDHDAGLIFRTVARRLESAVSAPRGRVAVAARGFWRSGDGKVYAEHGHQIGYSAHRFENWPVPFVRRAGRSHLARPWGEQLIQGFYNRLERKYPSVDNVAAFGAGVRYALAADGVTSVGDEAADLLRYQLLTTPWQQFRMELDDGEVEPPTWNLVAARAQGAALLVAAVPDDDPFKPVAAKALAEGRLEGSLDGLTDVELTALCDYRAALRRARRRNETVLTQLSGRGPVVAECPRAENSRGGRFEYFWRSRDLTFTQHLEAVARGSSTQTPPIMVFVHGHSHLPDRSQVAANMISGGLLKIPMEGFSPVRGATAPVVINGGAWQRTITPVQLERLKAERGLSYAELLASLSPEQLAPCYGFVQIGPYVDAPAPVVRYWRVDDSGKWAIASACGR
jgi:hypothetical protein